MRIFFLFCSCALFAAAAWRPAEAAPQVPPRRIRVTAARVTAGELLAGAGGKLTAEEAGRVVIASLRPGERRALSAGEVALALLRAGIDPSGRDLPLRAAVVERAAQVVPSETIVEAGVKQIEELLSLGPEETADISVLVPPKPMLAPVGKLRLEAMARRPVLRGGLWIAEVTGRVGKERFHCTLRYRVRVTGPVLVTRRAVRRHELLSADAVEVERRELTALRGNPIAATADLAGKRAARGVAAGTPVTTEWLEPVPAVCKGDSILAVTRVGAVSACARLVAAATGAVGQLIPARGMDGKSEVMVLITGPGRGEVTPGAKKGGR